MTTLLLDATPPAPYQHPDLDEQQLKVVQHRRGALRVLAGPGTGKTTTLVAAMADRLTGPDALRPDQVLGLTFGRRAALHWRDSVTAAVGGGAVPMVSTFHSFCYALLRKFAPDEAYHIATRLLSGPEQQVRAQDLFVNAVREGRIPWPEELAVAVGTRGMTEEVRTVMARARSHALDPVDLAQLGRSGGQPLWEPVAMFMEEYLDVLGFEGVLDYGELIYRTMLLCNEPNVRDFLHRTYAAIFVDEYQDTDPGQIELLRQMVTAETSLVVVGDFDQAIYGFRGADEAGIRVFSEDFASVYGANIHDVVLTNCRRFGSTIRQGASVVLDGYWPTQVPVSVVTEHRNPTCTNTDPGHIDVRTYDSEGAQAGHIADLIVREHAAGRSWSDMAVIVRSAVTSMAPIYRALAASGVPVEVGTDEIPLHQDPALAPLLDVLRCVDSADAITPDVAAALLTGPLGGCDPVDLRRLGRALRDEARSAGKVPPPSTWLVADALRQSGNLATVTSQSLAHVVTKVSALGDVIQAARERARRGATPHEVLWQVWHASAWSARLRTRALSGAHGSGRAHRDLDAICALFDQAQRFVARGRGKDLTVFLEELLAQQIPAETLAENELRGECVRIVTAHRSKGLEWPFVVIAAAQEDLWPNLVVPQTVLQPERIGRGEIVEPQTPREILDAERRLFYVAMTRAKEHLVITAVDASAHDDGARVSRFVESVVSASESLPGIEVTHTVGRPRQPLSAEGVIARLRRTLADPLASDALRRAAGSRLAALASSGRPQLAAADPAQWWGMRPVTVIDSQSSSAPVLSGTAIEEIEKCPARWFLERQVRAEAVKESPLVFGNALHKIAEGLASQSIEPNIEHIDALLDRMWPGMSYDAVWESKMQRSAAHDASVRLLAWFLEHSRFEAHVEARLSASIDVPHPHNAQETVTVGLKGYADRFEFTADGVVVYDYKTGRKAMENSELVKNIQLALYEYMLQKGTYDTAEHSGNRLPEGVNVSAAALVHLRLDSPDEPGLPRVQQVAAGTHDTKGELLEQRIAHAAHVVIGGRYETRYDPNTCGRCAVRFMCPASPEGGAVL